MLSILLFRLIKLRNLGLVQNLEDLLEEVADATSRNTRVWGVFGHLGKKI